MSHPHFRGPRLSTRDLKSPKFGLSPGPNSNSPDLGNDKDRSNGDTIEDDWEDLPTFGCRSECSRKTNNSKQSAGDSVSASSGTSTISFGHKDTSSVGDKNRSLGFSLSKVFGKVFGAKGNNNDKEDATDGKEKSTSAPTVFGSREDSQKQSTSKVAFNLRKSLGSPTKTGNKPGLLPISSEVSNSGPGSTPGSVILRGTSAPCSVPASVPGSGLGSRSNSRPNSCPNSRPASRSNTRPPSRPGSQKGSQNNSRGDSRNNSRNNSRAASRKNTPDMIPERPKNPCYTDGSNRVVTMQSFVPAGKARPGKPRCMPQAISTPFGQSPPWKMGPPTDSTSDDDIFGTRGGGNRRNRSRSRSGQSRKFSWGGAGAGGGSRKGSGSRKNSEGGSSRRNSSKSSVKNSVKSILKSVGLISGSNSNSPDFDEDDVVSEDNEDNSSRSDIFDPERETKRINKAENEAKNQPNTSVTVNKANASITTNNAKKKPRPKPSPGTRTERRLAAQKKFNAKQSWFDNPRAAYIIKIVFSGVMVLIVSGILFFAKFKKEGQNLDDPNSELYKTPLQLPGKWAMWKEPKEGGVDDIDGLSAFRHYDETIWLDDFRPGFAERVRDAQTGLIKLDKKRDKVQLLKQGLTWIYPFLGHGDLRTFGLRDENDFLNGGKRPTSLPPPRGQAREFLQRNGREDGRKGSKISTSSGSRTGSKESDHAVNPDAAPENPGQVDPVYASRLLALNAIQPPAYGFSIKHWREDVPYRLRLWDHAHANKFIKQSPYVRSCNLHFDKDRTDNRIVSVYTIQSADPLLWIGEFEHQRWTDDKIMAFIRRQIFRNGGQLWNGGQYLHMGQQILGMGHVLNGEAELYSQHPQNLGSFPVAVGKIVQDQGNGVTNVGPKVDANAAEGNGDPILFNPPSSNPSIHATMGTLQSVLSEFEQESTGHNTNSHPSLQELHLQNPHAPSGGRLPVRRLHDGEGPYNPTGISPDREDFVRRKRLLIRAVTKDLGLDFAVVKRYCVDIRGNDKFLSKRRQKCGDLSDGTGWLSGDNVLSMNSFATYNGFGTWRRNIDAYAHALNLLSGGRGFLEDVLCDASGGGSGESSRAGSKESRAGSKEEVCAKANPKAGDRKGGAKAEAVSVANNLPNNFYLFPDKRLHVPNYAKPFPRSIRLAPIGFGPHDGKNSDGKNYKKPGGKINRQLFLRFSKHVARFIDAFLGGMIPVTLSHYVDLDEVRKSKGFGYVDRKDHFESFGKRKGTGGGRAGDEHGWMLDWETLLEHQSAMGIIDMGGTSSVEFGTKEKLEAREVGAADHHGGRGQGGDDDYGTRGGGGFGVGGNDGGNPGAKPGPVRGSLTPVQEEVESTFEPGTPSPARTNSSPALSTEIFDQSNFVLLKDDIHPSDSQGSGSQNKHDSLFRAATDQIKARKIGPDSDHIDASELKQTIIDTMKNTDPQIHTEKLDKAFKRTIFKLWTHRGPLFQKFYAEAVAKERARRYEKALIEHDKVLDKVVADERRHSKEAWEHAGDVCTNSLPKKPEPPRGYKKSVKVSEVRGPVDPDAVVPVVAANPNSTVTVAETDVAASTAAGAGPAYEEQEEHDVETLFSRENYLEWCQKDSIGDGRYELIVLQKRFNIAVIEIWGNKKKGTRSGARGNLGVQGNIVRGNIDDYVLVSKIQKGEESRDKSLKPSPKAIRLWFDESTEEWRSFYVCSLDHNLPGDSDVRDVCAGIDDAPAGRTSSRTPPVSPVSPAAGGGLSLNESTGSIAPMYKTHSDHPVPVREPIPFNPSPGTAAENHQVDREQDPSGGVGFGGGGGGGSSWLDAIPDYRDEHLWFQKNALIYLTDADTYFSEHTAPASTISLGQTEYTMRNAENTGAGGDGKQVIDNTINSSAGRDQISGVSLARYYGRTFGSKEHFEAMLLTRFVKLAAHETGRFFQLQEEVIFDDVMRGFRWTKELDDIHFDLGPVSLRKLFYLVPFDIVRRYEMMVEWIDSVVEEAGEISELEGEAYEEVFGSWRMWFERRLAVIRRRGRMGSKGRMSSKGRMPSKESKQGGGDGDPNPIVTV